MGLGRKIHNLLHPALGQVLMLHRVVERIGIQPEAPRLEVTREGLIRNVESLQDEGVEFVGIDQVAERLKTKTQSPFACLTFDDGYLDTYTIAYPILKECQIPFCVYMTRDYYQGKAKPHWNPEVEMMNVAQMMELNSDALCTIGVHTCSHPHLSRLSKEEQRCEIEGCKTDLEQILGKPIKHLAYPYGDYNRETMELVQALGFETAVTTSGRPVRNDANVLELDRITFVENRLV